MLLFSKIENEETKVCSVGIGTDTEFYQSIGMSEMEVEQAYNGQWYLKGYAPQPSIEYQNEQIRQARQSRFAAEADPLKLDYDEAVARNENAEEARIAWLAKKDLIRSELPYIEE